MDEFSAGLWLSVFHSVSHLEFNINDAALTNWWSISI